MRWWALPPFLILLKQLAWTVKTRAHDPDDGHDRPEELTLNRPKQRRSSNYLLTHAAIRSLSVSHMLTDVENDRGGRGKGWDVGGATKWSRHPLPHAGQHQWILTVALLSPAVFTHLEWRLNNQLLHTDICVFIYLSGPRACVKGAVEPV